MGVSLGIGRKYFEEKPETICQLNAEVLQIIFFFWSVNHLSLSLWLRTDSAVLTCRFVQCLPRYPSIAGLRIPQLEQTPHTRQPARRPPILPHSSSHSPLGADWAAGRRRRRRRRGRWERGGGGGVAGVPPSYGGCCHRRLMWWVMDGTRWGLMSP